MQVSGRTMFVFAMLVATEAGGDGEQVSLRRRLQNIEAIPAGYGNMAIFLLVSWAILGCCGYCCFLRASRRASAGRTLMKVHDKVLHDQSNKLGNILKPEIEEVEEFLEDVDFLDNVLEHLPPAPQYLSPGELSPNAQLQPYVKNVRRRDAAKKLAQQQQDQSDLNGGVGEGPGELFGRNNVVPDIRNTHFVDNSSLNNLAANDDMTLVVGSNEQWGATLNPMS